MKQGLEINNKDYHAGSAVGSSTFKSYIKAPRLAYKQFIGEIANSNTKALRMGALTHGLVLEPAEFNNDFIIVDKYKEPNEEILNSITVIAPKECLTPTGLLSSSKKAKEIITQYEKEGIVITPDDAVMLGLYNDERIKVTQLEVDEAQKIATKALNYEFKLTIGEKVMFINTEALLNHEITTKERAFYAVVRDGEYIAKDDNYSFIDGDIDVKCKPDILVEIGENTFIAIDLKTGEDASAETASKVGGKFLNPLQESHYTKILKTNGLNVYKFLFLYVGKEEWSEAQHYEYCPMSREWGDKMLSKAIALHLKALSGEVRDCPFVNGEYNREPIITIPAYLQYME